MSKGHWKFVQWVFMYLKGTTGNAIMLSREHGDFSLVEYVDSDYACDMDYMRSTPKCVFTFVGGPIF